MAATTPSLAIEQIERWSGSAVSIACLVRHQAPAYDAGRDHNFNIHQAHKGRELPHEPPKKVSRGGCFLPVGWHDRLHSRSDLAAGFERLRLYERPGWPK